MHAVLKRRVTFTQEITFPRQIIFGLFYNFLNVGINFSLFCVGIAFHLGPLNIVMSILKLRYKMIN